MTCRCLKPAHFFHIDEIGNDGGPFIYIVGNEYEYKVEPTQWLGEKYDLYTVFNGKFSAKFVHYPLSGSNSGGRTFFDYFEIIP
jgi:phage-related protein